MKKTHQLINQSSGNVEYYTPLEIIHKARVVMGGIDLDPASSAVANKRVRAERFFTTKDRSLQSDWVGNIWLNHPFGRAEPPCPPGCPKQHTHHSYPFFGNNAWIKKLYEEYDYGNLEQACCITFAATSEKWFQPLLDFPMCFLSPRTNYFLPDGSIKRGVTKGSVVTYIGENVKKFKREFAFFGTIKI